MSVVQVNMVSGWIPDVSSLRSLINSSDIAVKRYDIDWKQPDQLNFYFDQVICAAPPEHKQSASIYIYMQNEGCRSVPFFSLQG